MPKYLLFKHYIGGPERHPELRADERVDRGRDHRAHGVPAPRGRVAARRRGEFVDVQALSPEGTYVRYGGPGTAPVTTDGPFPETKELAAGWFVIDVESKARAHEVAAYLSSAPGKGGQPLYEWIEARPVMSDAPAAAE